MSDAVKSFWSPLAILLAVMCLVASGCSDGVGSSSSSTELPPVNYGQLFSLLPSGYTGIDFANNLEDTQERNIFTYRNYYHGAGIATGDLTGNGLPDVFFSSNQDENRLYLNSGDFVFEDVTQRAGLTSANEWATCAVMADVNGNGLLDIYVCYSGDVDGSKRANELFINQGPDENGIPQFEERAAEFGVDDEGYTIHAAFFDYTGDGNLDLYVLNNSFRSVSSFGMRNLRNVRDEDGGDKLYRNDGETFLDVSEEAGIYGSEIGFSLGVAVGDVNNNGRLDIYVSNDFFERDYLYLNNGDGTFTEALEERFPYISHFSMGSDLADINNNGYLDLFVTDMLPEDNYRLKTTSSFEGWDVYQTRKRLGYHHQYMRNMLHRNNADGTFSDIGHLAGVSRTDWSWSTLIADFDLDGRKDIFVSNGMPKDLTEQDFISYLANEQRMELMSDGRVADAGQVDFLELIDMMESTPIPNYIFRNEGDYQFTNMASEWGIDQPASSHGAAYADLNGNGALDLIVSNNNQEVFVYRNNARELSDNRYLQITLDGDAPNRFGIGAKVALESEGQLFYQEQMPMRGFQSSVDYVLTFGVGDIDTLDTVTITWPDNRVEKMKEVPTNQRITVVQAEASPADVVSPEQSAPYAETAWFSDVTGDIGLDAVHEENQFVDFDRDQLVPKMLSREGPALAVGDLTGNGFDDVYLGGAKGKAGKLFLQQVNGTFEPSSEVVFEENRDSEDVGALFFDATGNGQLDLYVVSGGNEFSPVGPELVDRLYLNDGHGNLSKTKGHLPASYISGSVVAASDFLRDGAQHLFVGGRQIPWEYGRVPKSALLQNDGSGTFEDVTDQIAPELRDIGLVTDASWQDITGNGYDDLIIVGEWMPITIFENTGHGKLERMDLAELQHTHGWWNRLVARDLTGNGHVDFVLGNLGLNTRLQASPDEPVTMLVDDFNRNGSVEQILSYYNDGESYPMKMRNNLVSVLNEMRSDFPTYADYAEARTVDLFDEERRNAALEQKATMFESAVLLNHGGGELELKPLPRLSQQAPGYGIWVDDFDGDGHVDILLTGNFHGVLPEIGRMGSSWGVLLAGDGEGDFTPVPATERGVQIPGETRHLKPVRHATLGQIGMAARNNAAPLFIRPNYQDTPVAAGH